MGTCHLLEHRSQLPERGEGERKRGQFLGVELPVGSGDRNVAEDVGPEPDDTTAAQVSNLGNAQQGQRPTAERMARINDGNRLVRRECCIDRGSLLVEVCRSLPRR